ncbi:unnamed protein product [Scytosiphon promiscuus]
MELLMRCGVSLGVATFLLAGSLDAFGVGSSPVAIGNVDLDTTLPLSKATFWQFAHSPDFYRRTRQQSGTVRQEVVDLSNWVQADGTSSIITDGANSQPQADAASNSASALQETAPASPNGRRTSASSLRGALPRSARLRDRQRQQREPQQEQQELGRKEEHPRQEPRPRLWHRKARLTYAISSPFGSSDATVQQEHTLLEQREEDGGGICYSEVDCITGFPMVAGDLSVKTTFLVTAADGDPERVRVRVR